LRANTSLDVFEHSVAVRKIDRRIGTAKFLRELIDREILVVTFDDDTDLVAAVKQLGGNHRSHLPVSNQSYSHA
jgi:hypothetical protein